MKNTKKLVIFDLDGTLLDSVYDIMESANHVRMIYNLQPLQLEDIYNLMGDGIVVFVEKLFKDHFEVPKFALNEFKNFYKNNIANKTKPFDGVIEVLKHLKANNYTIGVLSNKSEELTRKVLNLLKLDSYFQFICGGNTFIEKKPSKLPIEKILKIHNFKNSEAVIIGDSTNDINAGKSAGISTIAVLYGYSEKDILLNCNPDCTIDSPIELKYIL